MRLKIYAKPGEIEKRRKLRGWSQMDFAENKLGKNYQWYNQAEKGKKSMSFETAQKICQVLGAEFDALFELREEPFEVLTSASEPVGSLSYSSPLGRKQAQHHLIEDTEDDQVFDSSILEIPAVQMMVDIFSNPSISPSRKKRVAKQIESLLELLVDVWNERV